MKAKVVHYKLLSPLHICFYFTLIALTFSTHAHAEYALVYGGGEPAMVDIQGSYAHHAPLRHHAYMHHRNSYNIEVYYFLQPDCCGARSYYVPVVEAAPMEYAPVRTHYYRNSGVVFTSQPDMYSGSQINDVNYGYDSDQRTGDDYGAGMDIDYY
jgi:hypothetical protein